MKNTLPIFALIGGVIVLVALGAGFFLQGDGGDSRPAEVSDRPAAPSPEGTLDRLANIALADYDGNEVTLEDFRGKPLVLNSWATWCPFCRQELPDFARLQEELGDTTVVIAIDRAEKLAAVKGYTDQFGITLKMTFLIDPKDAFYRNIGGFSMPETLFVDSSGAIVFHKRGPLTLEEMRAAAEQYLK